MLIVPVIHAYNTRLQILCVISYLDPKTFYILFITYKSHYCCLQAKDMIPCKSLECLGIV